MKKCAIISLTAHQKVTPGLFCNEVKQQMNSTIVKELLTKHFGSPQDSLTLSKSRKQGVQPQDLKNLAQLDAKTVSDAVTLPLFYETFWADVFLSEYYKSIFAYLGLPGSLAAEYVRLCKKTGGEVPHRLRSFRF